MSDINTIISAAFTKFVKADDKAREAIKAARAALIDILKAHGITSRELATPYATQWASKAYGCPLKAGEGKAKGQTVLDRTHAEYETARKAKGRVLAVFETEQSVDKAEAKPTETPVTEAEKALCAAFIATCGSASRAKAVLKAFAA
jgi:hypothetical protein